MAANCERKNTTCATAAIGSGTPSQPQRFNLNHATFDQPMACLPKKQLTTSKKRGQCTSGSYVQSATTPYSRAPRTTSYISTPGLIVHDITYGHDHCFYDSTSLTTSTRTTSRKYRSTHVRHWAIMIATTLDSNVYSTKSVWYKDSVTCLKSSVTFRVVLHR